MFQAGAAQCFQALSGAGRALLLLPTTDPECHQAVRQSQHRLARRARTLPTPGRPHGILREELSEESRAAHPPSWQRVLHPPSELSPITVGRTERPQHRTLSKIRNIRGTATAGKARASRGRPGQRQDVLRSEMRPPEPCAQVRILLGASRAARACAVHRSAQRAGLARRRSSWPPGPRRR